jgi:hypothetical protein
LAHVVQQDGGGAIDSAATIRRACGPEAIGASAGCGAGDKAFVDGAVFRFSVNCDDWTGGADAGLLDYAQTIPAASTIEIHGYASVDGPEAFNSNLACARALKAKSWLMAAGIAESRMTHLVNHGATAGNAADRRSVVIRPVGAAPAPAPDITSASTPKTDTPKTDTPKTDTPKTDTPKTDTPKTDTPKTDTQHHRRPTRRNRTRASRRPARAARRSACKPASATYRTIIPRPPARTTRCTSGCFRPWPPTPDSTMPTRKVVRNASYSRRFSTV